MTADTAARPGIRRQLYDILEQSRHGDLAGRLVEVLILALVLINIAAVILATVPDLDRRFHGWFVAIEVVSLVVFTIEYGLRIYVAVEHEPYKHLKAWQARWHYIEESRGHRRFRCDPAVLVRICRAGRGPHRHGASGASLP